MGNKIEFIRSISKLAPVAFGAVDLYKDQLICSSGLAEKQLGYTKEELVYHSKNNFESIIHPDDLLESELAIKKLMESKAGEIVESTFRVKRSDGKYLCLFVRDLVFEWDEEDKPLKYATVVQDITEVMELEKELAKKVKAPDDIALKNAHELRGPVATILGLVDLMKKENFKTEYNEKIFHHLEKTVKKLDEVIHDINNLSYA
ncbi:PAS domain-containing protein [Fulvivirgaceae bacterium BMA10]|uniref:histidine kinase n=1 Tax=Splendidivirga corallicola TaxID=3051826 RepID=A0ABT8KQL8_9BACT|nr:PAS domain-containing protein [Fulvivirgaceae bacterium BMA10]